MASTTQLAAATALITLGPHFRTLLTGSPTTRRGARAFGVLAGSVGAILAYQAWRRARTLAASQTDNLANGKPHRHDEEEEEEDGPPGGNWYYAAAAVIALISALRARTKRTNGSMFNLPLFVAIAAAPTLAELIAEGEGDVPACLAIALGLLMNQAKAASVILLMVTGGEKLEEIAMDRAGTALQTLLHENPGLARLESGQDVPAESVEPGQIFLVRSNEAVAVDGVLVLAEGEASAFDEKLITGESASANKRAGDAVYAGTVNRGTQAVRVRATKKYSDSVFQQMKSTLAVALERKSKVELNSKRIADALTPLTLWAASAGYVLATYVRGLSPLQGWEVVLSVMMSATPCPAAIGVPVAMLSGMSLASRKLGSTIKSGDALEALADSKCVVFDKTGTLTFGSPVVSSFTAEPTDHASEALRMVASLERLSKHVLADAVFKHGTVTGAGAATLPVTDYNESSGLGVSGIVDGKYRVWVGANDFCGVPPDPAKDDTLRAYFRISPVDDEKETWCSGVISFRDPIRPEAMDVVSNLHARGLKVYILSGDRSNHLRSVAETLGVDGYYACLPHEKADHVVRLQKEVGKVIFVGDGANDTPALAAADVGVSVDASSLASESADVVVLSGDISRLDGLIKLSQGCVRIARRTVRGGTTASLLQMVGAALGITTPFQNAVMQEFVDLTAVLHSMTAMGVSS